MARMTIKVYVSFPVRVNLTARLNNEGLINDYSAQRASSCPRLTTGAWPSRDTTYTPTHTFLHHVMSLLSVSLFLLTLTSLTYNLKAFSYSRHIDFIFTVRKIWVLLIKCIILPTPKSQQAMTESRHAKCIYFWYLFFDCLRWSVWVQALISLLWISPSKCNFTWPQIYFI